MISTMDFKRSLSSNTKMSSLPTVGENGLQKHFTTSGQVIGFGPREALGLRRGYAMMI
jgi:hypothetical protein